MLYSEIWANSNDVAFQGRCWAGLWSVAELVSQLEPGYPNTAADLKYADVVLKQETVLTAPQLAAQVLRSDDDPTQGSEVTTDAYIHAQIKNNIWGLLRGIG
jgi:hypothetical protein